MAPKKKLDKVAPKTEKVVTPQVSHKKSQATTMEELLSQTGYSLKGVKKGDTVEGIVSRVAHKEVTIDIGGKTEGVVIDRELETYKATIKA